MPSFSQRMGLKPIVKPIQLGTMDMDLRIGLWNVIDLGVLKKLNVRSRTSGTYASFNQFFKKLYHDFFKKTVDSIPTDNEVAISRLRNEFFKFSNWADVYDLVEHIVKIVEEGSFANVDAQNLEDQLNIVLEREFSAYRLINKIITPISNSIEIEAIEESISASSNLTSLKSCNLHLQSALEKISDRNNPDYRNSIKESISAVESLAKLLSGKDRDTLGAALDKIKGSLKIHPALERGFKQIYGYTSDSDGIRHAMTEESNVDFEDAKYMLVSCSAFINYLIVKAQKAGFSF